MSEIELCDLAKTCVGLLDIFLDSHANRLFAVFTKLDDEAVRNCGIPISALNPDSDGNGIVAKWELEVYERIKRADADSSGSIKTKELFSVIKAAAESDKQKRLCTHAVRGSQALVPNPTPLRQSF